MPDPLGIALSSLKAFDCKLKINANNIANAQTINFKKSRAELQESANGGVKVIISKMVSAGMNRDWNPETGNNDQASNVSLEKEFAEMIVFSYAYRANFVTIQTAKKIQDTLNISRFHSSPIFLQSKGCDNPSEDIEKLHNLC